MKTDVAARPQLRGPVVTVREDGPGGWQVLRHAYDFERNGERATVCVGVFGPPLRAGQWYWIGVAAPHPQAGAYLGRFAESYTHHFYFNQVRRLDGPAPGPS